MADIVLGLATSHTPMLTLPAELWPSFAKNDERNPELAFPPHGLVMPYTGSGRRDLARGAAPDIAGRSPIARRAKRASARSTSCRAPCAPSIRTSP